MTWANGFNLDRFMPEVLCVSQGEALGKGGKIQTPCPSSLGFQQWKVVSRSCLPWSVFLVWHDVACQWLIDFFFDMMYWWQVFGTRWSLWAQGHLQAVQPGATTRMRMRGPTCKRLWTLFRRSLERFTAFTAGGSVSPWTVVFQFYAQDGMLLGWMFVWHEFGQIWIWFGLKLKCQEANLRQWEYWKRTGSQIMESSKRFSRMPSCPQQPRVWSTSSNSCHWPVRRLTSLGCINCQHTQHLVYRKECFFHFSTSDGNSTQSSFHVLCFMAGGFRKCFKWDAAVANLTPGRCVSSIIANVELRQNFILRITWCTWSSWLWPLAVISWVWNLKPFRMQRIANLFVEGCPCRVFEEQWQLVFTFLSGLLSSTCV